jgi:hydroxymethylglutaryl-CoA synthase
MSAGILGYGVYIPKLRIKREDIGKAWGGRGRGENSVAHFNEDVITMAVEASQNAIKNAGINPAELGAIYLGTASAPNVEGSSVGVIALTLGCKSAIDLTDFGASTRASVAALKACLDAIDAGRIKYGLVIGSDFRLGEPGSDQESNMGAAAVAFVLGKGDTVVQIEKIFTYSTAFRDAWRADGQRHINMFEPRFNREFGYERHVRTAASNLLKDSGRSITDFKYVVFQQPDDRLPRTVARALKVTPEQMDPANVFPVTGDCGSASMFLGLAAILDRAQPGERIMAVSYGSGVSDALSLITTPQIEQKRPRERNYQSYLNSKEYIPYTTFLRHVGVLKKPGKAADLGMNPMTPLLSSYRQAAELLQLLGGKCQRCGYVNFPPSERLICIRCGYTKFDRVALARRGKIHTYTIAYVLPPGFDETPFPMIIADLEDGVRHRAVGTEMKPEQIKIGMDVEFVFRRISTEDGVNVYGNAFRMPR